MSISPKTKAFIVWLDSELAKDRKNAPRIGDFIHSYDESREGLKSITTELLDLVYSKS